MIRTYDSARWQHADRQDVRLWQEPGFERGGNTSNGSNGPIVDGDMAGKTFSTGCLTRIHAIFTHR
jgi:hypothetical protein